LALHSIDFVKAKAFLHFTSPHLLHNLLFRTHALKCKWKYFWPPL